MMKRSYIYKILLCVLLYLLLGCGVETGNPSNLYESINLNPATGEVTATLAHALCTKINTCFGPVPEDCGNEMLYADNITNELGLNTVLYIDLLDVKTDEENSLIGVSSSDYTICANEIDLLSCSDSRVTEAYSESQPNNYENAYKLLGASSDCQQIYY